MPKGKRRTGPASAVLEREQMRAAMEEDLESSARARWAEIQASTAMCGEPVAPNERAAAVLAACDADLNRRDACGDGA